MKYLNLFVVLTLVIGMFVGFYAYKDLSLRVQILEDQNKYMEILK